MFDEFRLFPRAASTVARDVDALFLTLIGLSSVFTLIVIILIAYFGIKYRRGKEADRSNPPLTSLKVELGWIVGLLVLAMGTFVWSALLYYRIFTPPAEALEVYVVGKQWMWKFQHEEGPQEINQLHVPQGEAVRLVMISQDVIHSFYVPDFRLKHDVLPGRYTDLWFEATEPGEYYIFCAEYCGAEHAGMVGEIIVMEPGDYQAWLDRGTAAATAAQMGAELFEKSGCIDCHGAQDEARAPSLVGTFANPVRLDGGKSILADESYLRESILFPQKKVVSGYQPIMPTYQEQLTEEELAQLVAYIKSLDSPARAENILPVENP